LNAYKTGGEAFPKESVAIDKFVVNVSEDVLTDLKRRLESARYVEPIAGTAFNYGFNSDYLKKVIAYWRNTYDWRKTETLLNQFPQFKTRIHGIEVHFIHVKPSKPAKTVVPLLVCHKT
jgi:microsomal epoxide hydrolase